MTLRHGQRILYLALVVAWSTNTAEAGFVLFSDNFESYAGTASYGTSEVIANAAGTGLGPADVNVPNVDWEPKIATATNTDIKAVDGTASQIAWLGAASGQNGLGISTAGYTVAGISADLIRQTTSTGSVLGLGFWSSFPAGTANPATNFTGFRVTATQIQLMQGGSLVAGGTINHGDANVLAVAGAAYPFSYDVNSNGSFAKVVLNGTDYTSSLSAVNVPGIFTTSATAYAGAMVNNGGNGRGAIDNFVVTAGEIPEPASCLLAFCAGLIALQRQQRRSDALFA